MKNHGWCLLLVFLMAFPRLSLADEKSTYNFKWLDPEKEVYVLQNRKFRKAGKLHLGLSGGKTISGAFSDAFVAQGKMGYFFTENFGIEALYSSNSSETNDVYDSVRRTGSGAIPFVRLVESYYGVMGLWSPFYSKINIFDKIVYFDWIFGLGVAKLSEENNRNALNTNNPDSPRTSKEHTGVIWSSIWKFFLTETFSVRVDITTVHYQAQKALANTTEEVWYDNFDLNLGVELNF
jgi:outer membrane beta-barrel protein